MLGVQGFGGVEGLGVVTPPRVCSAKVSVSSVSTPKPAVGTGGSWSSPSTTHPSCAAARTHSTAASYWMNALIPARPATDVLLSALDLVPAELTKWPWTQCEQSMTLASHL